MLRELFLGFIRVHILYHAQKAPVYGAEMIKELANHGYSLSPGTLYPILHSMEEQGLIVYAKEIKGGKMVKCYRATKQGEEILRQARIKIAELVEEVMEGENDNGG